MHLPRLALALLATLSLSSCVYTNVRVPLDEDLDETVVGTKTGESSYESILWLVSWGDAGIQAAAKNGGLTTLHHADQEILSVLAGFLYYRQTTIVSGE